MNRARSPHQQTPPAHLVMTWFRPQARTARGSRAHLSSMLLVVIASLLLSANLTIAQDAAPGETPAEPAPVEAVQTEPPSPAAPDPSEPVQPSPPPIGSLEIRLTGSTGGPLTGLFAVYDAAGTHHQRWTDNGVASFSDLIAGQAMVYQLDGTPDFAFDASTPHVIDVPVGGQATLPLTNEFLDADGDGVGDSVDRCGSGDDTVDVDANGTPDACDAPPTLTPPLEAAPEESSEISAMVADEPLIVEEAPVTCQQAAAVSPWVITDLADYPPGSLVTLSGGDWVAGQIIEILVEDDGLADAEQGPWDHMATVTADEQGNFTYQFTIAPWFVADYTVVAIGECSAAQTTFTDSVSGPECSQIDPADDDVSTGHPYVEFNCTTHQKLTGTTYTRSISAPSAGWLTSIDNATPSNSPHDEEDVDTLNHRKIALSRDPAYSPPIRVGRVTVTVSTTVDGVTTTTTTILEAHDSSVPFPACTPTASLAGGSLDFGTLAWTGNQFPESTPAPLAIQISSSGADCSGFPATWSIQASTTDLTNDDGGTIPADAISYTGTASGSMPPSNFSPETGPVALGTHVTTIANGNASTAPGTWTAGFTIAPPTTALPGTYTGTISITVSVAGT